MFDSKQSARTALYLGEGLTLPTNFITFFSLVNTFTYHLHMITILLTLTLLGLFTDMTVFSRTLSIAVISPDSVLWAAPTLVVSNPALMTNLFWICCRTWAPSVRISIGRWMNVILWTQVMKWIAIISHLIILYSYHILHIPYETVSTVVAFLVIMRPSISLVMAHATSIWENPNAYYHEVDIAASTVDQLWPMHIRSIIRIFNFPVFERLGFIIVKKCIQSPW